MKIETFYAVFRYKSKYILETYTFEKYGIDCCDYYNSRKHQLKSLKVSLFDIFEDPKFDEKTGKVILGNLKDKNKYELRDKDLEIIYKPTISKQRLYLNVGEALYNFRQKDHKQIYMVSTIKEEAEEYLNKLLEEEEKEEREKQTRKLAQYKAKENNVETLTKKVETLTKQLEVALKKCKKN